MTQRWHGTREGNTDYFDNEDFQYEAEGLGGTQAAQLSRQVSQTVTPGGVEMRYNCPHCARQIGALITWAEVAMMAHGLQPDDPRFARFRLTDTKYTSRPGNFSPQIPCRTGCAKDGIVWIARKEMETSLRQGQSHGFVQRDPMFPRLKAALDPIRHSVGAPPL